MLSKIGNHLTPYVTESFKMYEVTSTASPHLLLNLDFGNSHYLENDNKCGKTVMGINLFRFFYIFYLKTFLSGTREENTLRLKTKWPLLTLDFTEKKTSVLLGNARRHKSSPAISELLHSVRQTVRRR